MKTNKMRRSLVMAYTIWLIFGIFGAHRLYLWKTKTALIIGALSIVGVLTSIIVIGFIPLFIAIAWWLVDIILIPGMVYEANARRKENK